MILRRLSEHVQNQNWFAVILDFVIVVVGVYIGVLLGNWNGTQKERTLYQQSYDRMIVEQQGNLKDLEDKLEGLKEPIKTVQLALDDLRTCRTGDDAVARVEAAFVPLGIRHYVTVNTTALDQLINNDAFLSFQSPELRKQLLDLSTFLKNAQRASTDVVDTVVENEMVSMPTEKGPLVYSGPEEVVEAILRGAPRSPELLRKTHLKEPLATACRNEKFLEYFYQWEDNSYYQFVLSSGVASRLRSQLNAFGALTDADSKKTDPAAVTP